MSGYRARLLENPTGVFLLARTHQIREAIIGGRVQITRCGDDACEVISTKLLGDGRF